MMMLGLLVCLNSFMCGAICMLIALCIQPEVVIAMRKVITYNNSKEKLNERLLHLYGSINGHLNTLFDMTRLAYNDEIEKDVTALWDEIDAEMDLLKELLTDDKEKKMD